MKRDKHELGPEKLRKTFDPSRFDAATTDCLEPLSDIIGQKRAVQALRFGLGIQEPGYNVYVAGPPGIGKMTAVKAYLESHAAGKATPSDWCFVNNFEDPYQPAALRLPPGRGREFKQDMKELVEHLKRDVRRAFESDEYTARRQQVVKEFDRRRTQLRERLDEEASRTGFALEPTPMGLAMMPMLEGRPLKESEFQGLPHETRDSIQKRREGLQEKITEAMKALRDLERGARKQVQALDEEVALFAVGGPISDLVEKYTSLPQVVDFLNLVQKQILESIEMFKASPGDGAPSPAEAAAMAYEHEKSIRMFEVNLLVDNGRTKGAPVVVELNPSYNNLFGRVEKETRFGALSTDFTLIKAGSLHQANGGYLVLPMEDVFRNLGSWEGLKRSLRSASIEIEELGERLGFLAVKSLKPQPIPLEVKVLLVGKTLYYHLLHAYDEEFPELFKVKAEFDTRTDYNEESTRDYLAFICTYCKERKLRPLDGSALARLLEFAMRLADDQKKLSTHFGALADMIAESQYWAAKEGSETVTAAHVVKALDEKIYRASLMKERIQEMMERGSILIDTAGEAVGQVNGLSVLSLGDYAFGKPSRITATVGPGRGGILDIEREVKLGGPTHSKGVMILGGCLSRFYARDHPLALSARLVFEQSYDGVDGDSASSTELYAILSALSGAPIRQGVAVTGSVNQKGEVQAIGGVNQKVEGYFEVCRAKGLTGDQGVMIPRSNEDNLMLKEEVVEAVREGRFHIWSVGHVDEGIEILTGVPAGRREGDGPYPDATIHGRAERRLATYRKTMKSMGGSGSDADKNGGSESGSREEPRKRKSPKGSSRRG